MAAQWQLKTARDWAKAGPTIGQRNGTMAMATQGDDSNQSLTRQLASRPAQEDMMSTRAIVFVKHGHASNADDDADDVDESDDDDDNASKCCLVVHNNANGNERDYDDDGPRATTSSS